MGASDDEGFVVVDAHGPNIRPSARRAPTRKSARKKLPAIPKASSPQEPTNDTLGLNHAHPSRRAPSTSPVKRKRSTSSAARSPARSSSPCEIDELDEGASRRYKKPAASSSSPKDVSAANSSPAKRKSKAADKEAKPKKPSKAALERAKLEEIRKDKHFKKLDDAAIKRIAKAHHERLYLIHRYRDGVQLKEAFDVCGSKGNVYKILIDRNVSCSCMDFKLRRQVCKHLLFVYIKVLRLASNLPVYSDIRLTQDQVQQVFDESLSDPVAQALAKPELRDAWKKAVGYKSDDSETASDSSASGSNDAPVGKRLIPEEGDVCGVCYEDLEPGSVEGLEFCLKSCGRPIHTDCLETWFKTRGFARTCIWCRGKWHDAYEEQTHCKKDNGYGIGIGRRGAVVDSSGRQLNLAAAVGRDEDVMDVADAADPEVHDPDTLPDAAEANEPNGWD
ncbi:uncharacterized protein UTRI_01659 [Ustilago trichophora]|uniref:SWIM-type domain-containing protein n=1 Tax=Ustilago trichophora TaxID=86804 RepID=A0A5C3E0A1_9BASI|nr:uncharacterized protein UTRI_01659 [Ustilago trichophora]